LTTLGVFASGIISLAHCVALQDNFQISAELQQPYQLAQVKTKTRSGSHDATALHQ